MRSCFKGKFRVTSPYGERTLNGVTSTHYGIDLVGLEDTTVYAPCDGVIGTSTIITNKSNKTWEWGEYIRLDTADGTHSIYLCHLAKRMVSKGQKVKKGDRLGVMGNTGYSFGAHTHYEVRLYGTSNRIQPAKFIGIPNKVGVYEEKKERTLAENIDILHKHGVINTPDYWLENAPKIKYCEELIRKMAEALEK
jgi:murein DD-endopeptidase MepM/ murein hydrolase activator NlpD